VLSDDKASIGVANLKGRPPQSPRPQRTHWPRLPIGPLGDEPPRSHETIVHQFPDLLVELHGRNRP
jgi:hypothetical protein